MDCIPLFPARQQQVVEVGPDANWTTRYSALGGRLKVPYGE